MEKIKQWTEIWNKKEAQLAQELGTDPFQCQLQSASGNGEETLVIITDKVPYDDLQSEGDVKLFGGESGSTFIRIFSHCIKNSQFKVKQLHVINYHAFKINRLDSYNKEKAQEFFLKRVKSFCKQVKPDRVLFLGNECYTKWTGDLSQTKWINGFDRWIDEPWGKIRCCVTLPISSFGTTNSAEVEKGSQLAGFVVRHLNMFFQNKSDERSIAKSVIKRQDKFINSMVLFKQFVKELKVCKTPALDFETKNLSIWVNQQLTLHCYIRETNTAWCLPLNHKQTPFDGSDLILIKNSLKDWLFNNSNKYHVYHNAKFDVHQMMSLLEVDFYPNRIYDTMAGAFTLDENRTFIGNSSDNGMFNCIVFNKREGPYSLSKLELELDFDRETLEDLGVKKSDRDNLSNIDLNLVYKYGNLDAVTTWWIHKRQTQMGHDKFLQVVVDQIGSMIHSFVVMERNGTVVDHKYMLGLQAKNSPVSKQIAEVEAQLHNSPNAIRANKLLLKKYNISQSTLYSDKPFWFLKLTRPEHKATLFFDVMGLEPVGTGKEGVPSTDKKFQEFYKDLPEIQILSKYNQIKKIKDAFITGTWKIVNKNLDSLYDGKIRSSYGFTGVVSGRSSAKDPNMQNQPSRGPLAKMIKRQFIAPQGGYILVDADFSAHEVRNWGNISGDVKIRENFIKGLRAKQQMRLKAIDGKKDKEYLRLRTLVEELGDVHSLNYEFFFGRKPQNKNERNSVKSVVFGVLYGKTAHSLAKDIGCSEREAQNLIDKMFQVFKRGGDFIQATMQEARTNKIIYNPMGRPRHLYGYFNNTYGLHNKLDRKGPNSIIQGLSSDQGFLAGRIMQELIYQLLVLNDLPQSYILQNMIHDSTKGCCKIEDLPLVIYLLEHSMTSQTHKRCSEVFGYDFNTDLEVDVEVGSTQRDMIGLDGTLYATPDDNKHLLKPDDMGVGLLWAVEQSIDHMNEELGYELDKDKYLSTVEHNQLIISKLRKQELQMQLKQNEPNKVMLLNSDNIKDLGLIFSKKDKQAKEAIKSKEKRNQVSVKIEALVNQL